MPRYTVKVGHYLILETSVVIDALDAKRARLIAENMRDLHAFGSITWKVVNDSPVTEGKWQVVSQYVEVETVQEESSGHHVNERH
jgi:hypothetical protein